MMCVKSLSFRNICTWKKAKKNPSVYTLYMKIKRMDHIGINVRDLATAKAFFLALGLKVEGEMEMEGDLVDAVTALKNVKTSMVWLTVPGSNTKIELVQYHRPTDDTNAPLPASNTLGIRHLTFAVQDIEAVLAAIKKHGAEPFSEIQNYENTYKLCYVRGPDGMIIELAEEL